MNRTETDQWILGISSSHNGSACLLRGDQIAVAIQEERLMRYKRAEHPLSEPSLSIQYCLDSAGINASQLAAIVTTTTWPMNATRDDTAINRLLRPALHDTPVINISHHYAHAVGAYATSGFRSAAVLVVDGNGSRWEDLSVSERALVDADEYKRHTGPNTRSVREIISLYSASCTGLEPVMKHISSVTARKKEGMGIFGSLGDMYGFIGAQIFGSFFEGPGKVMGLAPYGRPTTPTSEFYRYENQRFEFLENVPELYLHDEHWPKRQEEYKDLAASVQAALEEALLSLLRDARQLNASSDLCYAGGVALNSVANEKLVRSGLYENVFIMPAAEDSGPAIGAAYHGLWQLTDRMHSKRQVRDSHGKSYSRETARSLATATKCLRVTESDDITEEAANLLAEGHLLGWFQGGAELGPRALGFRSILCDPRQASIKDTLNSRVKFREGFRPFAPLILQDHVTDWFDVPPKLSESPFMLRVMRFREGKQNLVPGVVHVDGTGRVQTLCRESNPILFDLLSAFYKKTGVPILLNTSFNIAGEPIVETPEDALWCFQISGLDYCVFDNLFVTKNHRIDPIFNRIMITTASEIALEVPVRDSRLMLASRQLTKQSIYNPFSSHTDSLTGAMDAARILPGVRTRFRTQTPWGPATRWILGDLVPLFSVIDGRRTGWDVLQELRRDYPDLTEEVFKQLIASLYRMSIVRLADLTA